jgi:PIN domain nuclease of toxin-antitoxin system
MTDGVLADTQIVVWWLLDDERLPAAARELIEQGGVHVYVSAASIWEVAIKVGKAKLRVPADDLPAELEREGFDLLPVTPQDGWAVRDLPEHHGDPFDRLIIAQARAAGLPVLTVDPAFADYDVEVLA